MLNWVELKVSNITMYRLHFACNASDIEAILGGQKWKLLIGSHKEHLSCGTLIEMFKSPYVLVFLIRLH